MGEWKEGKISDVAEIITGFPFKGDKYEFTGELKVVRGENVTIGKLRWDSKKYWNHSVDGLDKYFLQENDVVIGMDGSRVGKNRSVIRREELPLILAQRVACLRAKKGFSQGYLNYLILSSYFPDYVDAIHTGTSIPHISQQQIADFEIIYPVSYNEQQAIAEVLSSLDDKIDLLHQQNKTLETLAETLFRHWFDNANCEWQEVSLGSVVEIMRGLSYKGAGLSNSNDVNAIPMINLNSVNEGGGFKYTGTKYYNGDYKERHLIVPGDVVITNTEQGHEHRLIGFSAIIPTSIGPKAIFSQHVYKLKPKDSRVTSLFINYLLNYSSLRDQVIGATNGSTVNMLSLEGLEKCKMQLPPKLLITKFEEFAKDIQAKKEVNIEQINQLETLRNNLLPKLMNGTVTISKE